MKKRFINYFFSKRILSALTAMLIISGSVYSSSVPLVAAEVQPEEIPESADTTILPVITAIAPLSDSEAEVSFSDKPSLENIAASLPPELSVFFDNGESPVPLSVTWECGDDYENTDFDIYEFTPLWDTEAYPLAPSIEPAADIPHITVYVSQETASIRLLNAEEAMSGLSSLAKEKDIYALLYLCDTYEVKQQPGKAEETVATISTGQSVRITGVGEDSLYNIWYQVSMDIGGSVYSGYIERDYLAYSDEAFLAWEEQAISSQTYLMASPAAAGIPADIDHFPSSYQSGLLNLKAAHPNWIFVRMDTKLDWQTAVKEENKESRSLISSSVNSAWKTAPFDKSWSYPTDGILAYYMDPRNFLTEKYIFQFEFLSYNETYHTESAVQGILNGTFMSGAIPGDSKGQSYAQAFCNIAKLLDVSPFHLASRVRQEQGDGKSDLISGTHPLYPGVYNYFNIGASGKGSAQVIENGLKKAAEYQWTTRYLSLEGGSNIISKEYIRKGQNTLYLQKFNVSNTSPSGLYKHQYMQNIAAPSSEAVSVQKAYAAAGSINNPFVFRIPVYEGMPSSACPQPAAKTDPPYTLPVLGAVTYAPEQTLGSIALPEGWKWDNPSIVPTVSNQGYPATFTPSDTNKYNTVQKTIVLTVNKGTPSYVIPSGLQTTVGNTLSSIKLPAGFSWESPSSLLQKEGTVSCTASYNPDEANYQTVTGIAIPVTVTKKPSSECTTHNYGEWVVSAPASCTASGTQTRSCGLCGAKETASIPSLGHSYSASVTQEPTETANGIRTYLCSRCSDTYTEAIDKLPSSHKHSYTSGTTTEPSCIATGILTYTCACGDSYTETIPALGHDYRSQVTKEATETEAGIRTYTCSRCQDSYTETIAKLPSSHKHSYSSSVIKQASCTEKGIKNYSCTCGDSYSEEIPALGHDMDDGKCRRCGYTEPNNDAGSGTENTGGSDGNESLVPDSNNNATNNGNISTNNNPSGSGNSNNSAPSGNTALGSNNASTNGSSTNGSNSTGNNPANGNNSNNIPGNSGNTTGGSNSNPASGTGSNMSGSGNSSAGSHNTASNSTPSDNSKLAATPNTNTTTASSTDSNQNAVTIDMKETTVLYEETISAIRGQDIDVVLNMGNSISWTINGSNIVADEANGIDMGILVNAKHIPEPLLEQAYSLSGTGTIIELSIAHDGPLDFHPVLTISTAVENAGRTANLYYYNPEPGQLEFVEGTQIGENGDICFTFSHASDYVVIISETVMTDNGTITAPSAFAESGEEAFPEEVPGSKPVDQPSSSLQLSTVLLIAVIVLIIIAICCTAFFLFRSKKDGENIEEEFEEEGDFLEEELEEEEDFLEEEFEKESFEEEDFEEEDWAILPNKDSDKDFPLDDGDSDDYHEPQQRNPVGNNSKKFHVKYDDDEFDGFE